MATLDDEDNILDYADEVQTPVEHTSYRYNIDSYTNAIPVERLVDDFMEQRIILPSFQRPYVWNKNDTNSARHKPSLFIDSVLQGLPIPSVSIYRNATDRDKGLLIDGQQRIKTLAWYIRGELEGKRGSFALKGEGINTAWLGKDFDHLDSEYKNALCRSYIPVTYIRQLSQDRPPLPEGSSLFILFDRLNSGGQQLQPHEKRNVLVIYNPARKVIEDLLAYSYVLPKWRIILPSKDIDVQTWRLTKINELIFRIYAFTLDGNSYNGNLARFLDNFMLKYNLDESTACKLKIATSKMLDILEELYNSIGKLFSPNNVFNTGFFEAFCVGLIKIILKNKTIDVQKLPAAYLDIVENRRYDGRDAGKRSSSAEKKVVAKRLADVATCLEQCIG